MNTSEVFAAAADLLTPPGAWIQMELAEDGHGDSVEPNNPAAVCWCAMGAIAKVTRKLGGQANDGAMAMLGRRLLEKGLITTYEDEDEDGNEVYIKRSDDETVPEWNDTIGRTQAEVVAMLRDLSLEAA